MRVISISYSLAFVCTPCVLGMSLGTKISTYFYVAVFNNIYFQLCFCGGKKYAVCDTLPRSNFYAESLHSIGGNLISDLPGFVLFSRFR